MDLSAGPLEEPELGGGGAGKDGTGDGGVEPGDVILRLEEEGDEGGNWKKRNFIIVTRFFFMNYNC